MLRRFAGGLVLLTSQFRYGVSHRIIHSIGMSAPFETSPLRLRLITAALVADVGLYGQCI